MVFHPYHCFHFETSPCSVDRVQQSDLDVLSAEENETLQRGTSGDEKEAEKPKALLVAGFT
jgi:hypothetical protein